MNWRFEQVVITAIGRLAVAVADVLEGWVAAGRRGAGRRSVPRDKCHLGPRAHLCILNGNECGRGKSSSPIPPPFVRPRPQ